VESEALVLVCLLGLVERCPKPCKEVNLRELYKGWLSTIWQ
jgi:hypothetical protein